MFLKKLCEVLDRNHGVKQLQNVKNIILENEASSILSVKHNFIYEIWLNYYLFEENAYNIPLYARYSITLYFEKIPSVSISLDLYKTSHFQWILLEYLAFAVYFLDRNSTEWFFQLFQSILTYKTYNTSFFSSKKYRYM